MSKHLKRNCKKVLTFEFMYYRILVMQLETVVFLKYFRELADGESK